MIPTDNAIFFGLPVSTGADDEPIGYLAALCLPRLLITLHLQPLSSLQEVAETLQRTAVLVSPTTSALVSGMLVHLSSLSIQLAQRFRRRVGVLTGQMDRDTDALDIKRLLAANSGPNESR